MKSPLLQQVTRALAMALTLVPISLSYAATVQVQVGNGGFTFTPATVTITAGDTVQWVWSSSGHSSTSGTPSAPDGLWDSKVINAGATFSHTFSSAGSFNYFCSLHGTCCNMVGLVNVAAPAPATTLSNLSTRARAGTGDNVVIGGFIVKGTGQKRVLIRALGPTLSQFNVPNVLQNPQLQIFSGQTVIAQNDDWKTGNQVQEITNTNLAPPNDFEAAVIMSPTEGNYTAIVSGVGGTSGAALVDIFDLDPAATAKLQNISTRAVVGTESDVMIGGVIIAGQGTQKVVVRALGPSLTQFGVAGALANPFLSVVDGNGQVVTSSDDWSSGTGAAELMSLNLAPPNSLEAAVVLNLAPGNYTAIESGVGQTSGIGLVEIYKIDPAAF